MVIKEKRMVIDYGTAWMSYRDSSKSLGASRIRQAPPFSPKQRTIFCIPTHFDLFLNKYNKQNKYVRNHAKAKGKSMIIYENTLIQWSLFSLIKFER